MSSYEDYQQRIIAAQDQWNKERSQIYGETRSFDSSFQGDFDKPVINYCEIYEGRPIEELRQKVSDMRPNLVREAATHWQNIGWNLMMASNEFNNNFARTVHGDGAHSGWTGQAASAAVDAVNNYTKQSQNLVSAAQVVGLKLAEAHTGLEQTQALFPGITQRPDIRGKTLPKDGVMKANDYHNDEEHAEAVRILRTVYGQVVVQTDQGVPVLPLPQQIADVPPGPVDPGVNQNNWPGNGTGGTGDNGGGGTKPGDPQNPNDGKPTDDKPGDGTDQNPATQTASTSQSPTSPSSAPQGGSGAQPGGLGTGTTPAGVSGTQSGGGSGIPGYGGFGRGGGLGTGGGAGGRGTNAGAPGRSVPGGPAQGPNVSPAAARLGGAAAGQSGMPGMGAPGHGKGKEDEREKSGVPDYLVTKEHGDELTGLDSLPKAVPPVIGGDYDRA